jgi:hypothetical protein
MKIANKISLSFLITPVILTTAALSIYYPMTRDNLEKAIFEHLTTAAESRANHVETFLEKHRQAVELLGAEIIFYELLSTNKDDPEYNKKSERVNDRLQNMIDIHGEILEVSLLDKNGMVVASTHEAAVGSDRSAEEIYLEAKESTIA